MRTGNAVIMTLALLIALAAVNFLVARHPFRLDLTENSIYTLSGSTEKILEGLDDIATIRVYFTKDLPPTMEALRRGVDDLLEEFKRAAGRRLQIEFIDPGTSLMEEQKVAMIGIPPVQLNVVGKDKQEIAKIYLGMAVLYGDKQQVIPVVARLGTLEYELAEALLKVSMPALPAIAWWERAGEKATGGGEFQILRQAIGRRYELTTITAETLDELDASKIPALVFASPRMLSSEELFALDQYLMNGGRVLAFIDRARIDPGLALKPVTTNAVDLIEHYGAEIRDALALDSSNATASFSGGVVTYHLPYPFWPDIRRDQFNAKQPIVADLETAVLPWTSPITLAHAAGNEAGSSSVVLARTTLAGTSVPIVGAKLDPRLANEELARGDERQEILIALLNGPFTSYFMTEGATPPEGTEVVRESVDGARLFVVGSSHWISDGLLTTFPTNATLFENALDAFAMGDMLIGIRSREASSRPIALLSEGAMATLRYGNIAAGPMLILLIGLVVYMIRRSKRSTAKIAYR